MNFSALREYQNSLFDYGIAGNDLIVCREGKPLYRHMTGMQDIENGIPVTEDTIFRMFSMTKPITCTGAMMLYEKGAFLLDDTLGEYMPEFLQMNVKTEDGGIRKANNPIRIIDLFTMSAGFNYNFNSPAFKEAMKATPDFSLQDLVSALSEEPLEFEPGSHYLYSFAHDVLGALIERLTGKTLGNYLSESIFSPLGMKSARFHLTAGQLPRLARTYPFEKGVHPSKALPEDFSPVSFSPRFESGGGGLSMTVNDYVKFANALCLGGKCPETGARLLSGGMIDAMRENQLDEVRLKEFSSGAGKAGYGYGLGVRTLLSKGRSGSAGCLGEFGWAGMCGTYLLIDPEKKLTVVYAQASLPGTNAFVHKRIRNLVYRAIED